MIQILVDSAADCRNSSFPYDALVPLTVTIDGREYLDGVNLDSDTFYRLLQSAETFPKTSQPSPEAFYTHFVKAKEAGDQILCFTLSSALSGTYQSAYIAKNMVDYEGIYIIDTRMASHLIGILTQYAHLLIASGLSAGVIADKCEEMKTRIKVFAGLDTLEYLYKGGRLSRTSAAVGQIAGIKPIITISAEGAVNAGSKAIGIPRAMATILAQLRTLELDPAFPVYTLYTSGTENTQKLEEKLTAEGYALGTRLQVGPTIGAHVGPGVYGVIAVTK